MASVASLLAAVACFAGTHGSTQLVTVQAAPHATTGTLSLWTRRGACWRRVAGPWAAHLGRTGISTHKHLRYHRLTCHSQRFSGPPRIAKILLRMRAGELL